MFNSMKKKSIKKLVFLMMLFGLMIVVTDSVSAQKCQPNDDQVAIMEHTPTDPRGPGICVVQGAGDYNNPEKMGMGKNSMSSIKVGKNVYAIVCTNNDFKGSCEKHLEDDGKFHDNLYVKNDQASSMKVLRKPAKTVKLSINNWDVDNNYNVYETIGGVEITVGTLKMHMPANNLTTIEIPTTPGAKISVKAKNESFGEVSIDNSPIQKAEILTGALGQVYPNNLPPGFNVKKECTERAIKEGFKWNFYVVTKPNSFTCHKAIFRKT
jgi:hypothetical protein